MRYSKKLENLGEVIYQTIGAIESDLDHKREPKLRTVHSQTNNIIKFIPADNLVTNKNQGVNDMAKLSLKGISIDKKPRKDGRWQARYTVKGVQYSVYGKTYDEVKEKVLRYATAKRAPSKRKKAPITKFGEWVEKWYELYKKPFIGESWNKSMQYCLNNYILPGLGKADIKSINLIDLQEIINDIPYKWPRRLAGQLLKNIFEKAAAVPLIKFNPATGLVKQEYETDERRPLTAKEQKTLIKYLNDKESTEFAALIQLYINTGLRRREALGIEPSDIDWHNGNIFIKSQLDLRSNELVKLKTKSSKRYVPLFPETKKILQKLDLSRKYIFNFKPDAVSKQFNTITNALGFPDIDIHCLRHTFTYNCEMKNIPDETVQRWLGHSKATTTKIYKHKAQNEEIEIIKEYISSLDTKFDT